MSNYSGKRVEVARAKARAMLPAVCVQCGQVVTQDMDYVAEHLIPRAIAKQMGMPDSEVDQHIAVSHRSCSDKSGAKVKAQVNAKKTAQKFEKVNRPGVFSASTKTPASCHSSFSYCEREEVSHDGE